MVKSVYIVYRGSVPEYVCSNMLTAYEALKQTVPILDREYLKSYETCARTFGKLKTNFECMTPTAYFVIKKHKVMQRKNAKPEQIGEGAKRSAGMQRE